jgi:hypothetical protein
MTIGELIDQANLHVDFWIPMPEISSKDAAAPLAWKF